MDLIPYNPSNKAIGEQRSEIYAAAKREGRQLTMQDAVNLKAARMGVNLEIPIPMFIVKEGSESDLEQKVLEYLEEHTGFSRDYMKIQVDKMAVRLFIPKEMYTEIKSHGIRIPCETMSDRPHMILVIKEKLWVPAISTSAKMFKQYGAKIELDSWWVTTLLSLKREYLKMTQKKIDAVQIQQMTNENNDKAKDADKNPRH